MGRKKQNPEDSLKRADILSVAGKMFLEEGYGDVSMDALAEAVPVSKRTLYNHFQDKETLFIAVMQSRCQSVFERFQSVLEEGRDVRETLTQFAHEFLNVVLKPQGVNIYRTVITQGQNFPKLSELFFERGPKRSLEMLADYLETVGKRGLLRVDKPKLAAGAFMGMLSNRMQMRCLLGLKKQVNEKEKKAIIRYAVDVFIKAHQE